MQQVWFPKSELERTVYAALVLAGEPVNNLKLAALMGVSPGEVLQDGSRSSSTRDQQAASGPRSFDFTELKLSPGHKPGLFVRRRCHQQMVSTTPRNSLHLNT